MFTDWTGRLEINKTYQTGNNMWSLVTDLNGHAYLIPLHGTFKVVSLQDWQGHRLNSTVLTNYNPHSGDVQKTYEELKKIEELYEQYLNNLQTSAGGGFNFNFSEWWNSLDTYAKIGVIAIACVAVYAILRK